MSAALPAAAPVSRLTKGYLICLTGTVIWSLTGIFIRYITQEFNMPPLLLAALRDFSVCVILLAAYLVIRPGLLRIPPGQMLFLAGYGLALTLLNTTWTVSVDLNGAAISTVVVYSSPAITAVVGWRLWGEPLGRVKLLAISLAILGIALISEAYNPAAWQLNLLGVVAGLLSGVAFAVYSLVGKASSLRKINPWTALFYSFAWATLFLTLVNLVAPENGGALTSRNFLFLGDAWLGWAALILLALGPTIGGYGLYTVSLGYLPSSVANLIATLEPVLTAILAFFLLNERMNGLQLLGGILVIAGVIALRVSEERKPDTG